MNQLSGSRVVEPYLERRILLALLLVVAVWGLLIARLFYLQVVEGDRYRVSSERNSVRTHRVIAPRGMILDRNGTILTDSRPSFEVLLVPSDSGDLDRTIERVAALAELDADQVRERVGVPTGRARFQPLRVARDLDRRQLALVETRLWALPGVLTQVSPVREYPYGGAAAHVLGWLGEISSRELKSSDYLGYRSGDSIGKGGVERLLDRELRGRDGGRNVLVDAHGRELERLDAVEAQPGKNVVLTLDQRLQAVAVEGFAAAERNGALVALDPRNGEVLALLSSPAFDPNRFAAGLDQEAWARLLADPAKPLHDRALQGQYPPGSTYKVVTALAGLEKQVIRPGFEVDCGGSYRLGRRRYRCWKRQGHGRVDLHRALVESCDVFFYQVGQAVGVDVLAHYARALGFGSATGIDIGREAAGLVPTSDWKQRRFGEKWIEGETLSVAIGQGFNQWTPLQLASAYGAIATGGTRYRPYVVKTLTDANGVQLQQNRPQIAGEVGISAAALAEVRSGLRGVVHEPHGTGWVMRGLPGGVEAAGKTGTAQVVALAENPERDEQKIPIAQRDHAWFVGYAPAEAPRIVVAVLLEHGGHGGSAAAPIAKRVIQTFLENEASDLGSVVAGN